MSDRIKQINELLRQELSKIILKEVDFSGILVTLTRVETTVSLTEARVYVSVIPDPEINSALKILNSNIYDLQQELNKRLDMRPVPKIYFTKETETIKAGRVEKILEDFKGKKH